MVIYFDMCCLKRPFDDQTQPRIAVETTAITALAREVDEHRLPAVRSLAHEMENSQNTNLNRANSVAAWLDTLNPLEPQPLAVAQRATELQQAGFRLMDALHIAWAEYLKADVLVTVDDSLLARSGRTQGIMIKVKEPVTLVKDLGL
jgi:predicted nucleic acid-binding protein